MLKFQNFFFDSQTLVILVLFIEMYFIKFVHVIT